MEEKKLTRNERLRRWAGTLKHKHRLTPLEAAWCVCWMTGTEEEKIEELAEGLLALRKRKES